MENVNQMQNWKTDLQSILECSFGEVKATETGFKMNTPALNTKQLKALADKSLTRRADVLVKRSGTGLVVIFTPIDELTKQMTPDFKEWADNEFIIKNGRLDTYLQLDRRNQNYHKKTGRNVSRHEFRTRLALWCEYHGYKLDLETYGKDNVLCFYIDTIHKSKS